MPISDSHTHLFSDQFSVDIHSIIRTATEGGIHRMIMPCVDSESILPMLQIAKDFPTTCFATKGLHPCSVTPNWQAELAKIDSEVPDNQIVAIGECGLDFFWDLTYVSEQEACLRAQIAMAHAKQKPIILHCRESLDRTIEILREEHAQYPIQGVFHCFGGDKYQIETILEFLPNMYFGIGGSVTFKTSTLPAVLPLIPLNRLLLETDSPYLAPVPFRGKRNESAYITYVLQKVAEVYQVSTQIIEQHTEQNVNSLFFNA